MNLDAYLARIGWDADLQADASTLAALCACHAASIAFENLDPLLDVGVSIDLPTVERKLVDGKRGGYCFEHNLLLADALRAIGFRHVDGLAARVLWNRPESVVTPQTHMLLRVTIDGESWIVDVGFGGLTLTGALRLVPEVEQATPHETFRLVPVRDEWRMEALVGGAWRALYRFDVAPRHAVDFEVANHWVSTHPASRFRHNLMAARAAPGVRLALLNGELAIHRLQGETERRRIEDAADLRGVLERDFLVRLPSHPRLDERLAQILARPPTPAPPT